MAVGRLKTNVMGCGCCDESNRICPLVHPLQAAEPWDTQFLPYEDYWIWPGPPYPTKLGNYTDPEYEITATTFRTYDPDNTHPQNHEINIYRTMDIFDEVGTYVSFDWEFEYHQNDNYVCSTPLFSCGTYDPITFSHRLSFFDGTGAIQFEDTAFNRGWSDGTLHRMTTIITRIGNDLEYEGVFWLDGIEEYYTTDYQVLSSNFGCNKSFQIRGYHPFGFLKTMAVRNLQLDGNFNATA